MNLTPRPPSDVRVWPADAETTLLKEESDPDFFRPPARDNSGFDGPASEEAPPEVLPEEEPSEEVPPEILPEEEPPDDLAEIEEEDGSLEAPVEPLDEQLCALSAHGDRVPEIEKETYVLTPNGNVLIKLNYEGSEVQYLVADQILRLVSPVWAKCLDRNAPFVIETDIVNGVETTILRLEDDDPDCLLNILRCFHFRHDEVPATISFETLRNFAIICDKYDCAKALQPWSKGYLNAWAVFALQRGYEDWLFISNVFNDKRHVDSLIEALVNQAGSLSICKTYFMRDGRVVDVALFPYTCICKMENPQHSE